MQNFKELYTELAGLLSDKIPAIEWVDLWNSQIYNLEGEHPFPAPAVFLAFRSNRMDDAGVKLQKVELQVDVFLFYETFLDTFNGAYNQEEALAFLDIMDEINKLLHGSSGTAYSNMRRISFSPVDTGGAGNLYNITYRCELMDYSAVKEWEEDSFADMQIEPQGNNGFIVNQ
ncbi:hypothetical protein GCM10008015_26700 [Flavobacterium palustre]|uniref:Uncharacterized protein n=1 Tax=Flavobacterium palustre TaxID=1476463 RepID=A0ABQ1HNQ0_9FLAO|nr:hypothetical protein [Flavobacterium palustre]GGA84573.1 hypothetical protein GCM10008015_26700 [Flavobacterium palustre]